MARNIALHQPMPSDIEQTTKSNSRLSCAASHDSFLLRYARAPQ